MKIYFDYPKGNEEIQTLCYVAKDIAEMFGIECFIPPKRGEGKPSNGYYRILISGPQYICYQPDLYQAEDWQRGVSMVRIMQELLNLHFAEE